jgi:hypothetical protein
MLTTRTWGGVAKWEFPPDEVVEMFEEVLAGERAEEPGEKKA